MNRRAKQWVEPTPPETIVAEITGIQFTMMNDQVIKRMSCDTVVNSSTEIKSGNSGTINSQRLGTISRYLSCKSCSAKNCHGHMGIIKPGVPLHNPIHLVPTFKIVNSECFFCFRLLFQPHYDYRTVALDISKKKKGVSKPQHSKMSLIAIREKKAKRLLDAGVRKNRDRDVLLEVLKDKRLSTKQRIDLIYKFCQNVKSCGAHVHDRRHEDEVTDAHTARYGCGSLQPTFTKKNIMIEVDGLPVSYHQEDCNELVYDMLNGLDAKDAETLGFMPSMAAIRRRNPEQFRQLTEAKLNIAQFSHPRNLMTNIIPVPPPKARSMNITHGGVNVTGNDITTRMKGIVTTNDRLLKFKNSADQGMAMLAPALPAATSTKSITSATVAQSKETLQFSSNKTLEDDVMGMVTNAERSTERFKKMSKAMKELCDLGTVSANRRMFMRKRKVVESFQDVCTRLKFDWWATQGGKGKSKAPRMDKRGQPLCDYTTYMKGKGGILQRKCGGKRINCSSRTVVGGSTHLHPDEAGIPRQICMTQVRPVHVTKLNIHKLQKLVQQGPHQWPGANNILVPANHPSVSKHRRAVRIRAQNDGKQPVKQMHTATTFMEALRVSGKDKGRMMAQRDGVTRIPMSVDEINVESMSTPTPPTSSTPSKTHKGEEYVLISLKYADLETIVLEPGMIVERHLQNGDLVILNRQPTLHRGSVMVHRVVCVDTNTIQLSNAATKPYNADYDGDEMNIYNVQGLTILPELDMMKPSDNILSLRNGGVQIGAIQNAIFGVWVQTLHGFRRGEYQELISVCPNTFRDFTNSAPEFVVPCSRADHWQHCCGFTDAISDVSLKESVCISVEQQHRQHQQLIACPGARWSGFQCAEFLWPSPTFIHPVGRTQDKNMKMYTPHQRYHRQWHRSKRGADTLNTLNVKSGDDGLRIRTRCFSSTNEMRAWCTHVRAQPLQIRDGRMLCGSLTKHNLDRITKCLVKDHSGKIAADFVHNVQVCSVYLLSVIGNTVSYEHCRNPDKKQSDTIIEQARCWMQAVSIHNRELKCATRTGGDKRVDNIFMDSTAHNISSVKRSNPLVELYLEQLKQIYNLTIVPETDICRLLRSLSSKVSESILNAMGDKFMTGEASEIKDGDHKHKHHHMMERNGLVDMAKSGTTGNFTMVSAIAGPTFTQSVNCKRYSAPTSNQSYHDEEHGYVPTMADEGVVTSAVSEQLSPNETLRSAALGRSGLVDTSVKTSEVGAIQKQMLETCRDLYLRQGDGCVVDVNGNLVQFEYGCDGNNTSRLERVLLPLLFGDTKWLKTNFDSRTLITACKDSCKDSTYFCSGVVRVLQGASVTQQQQWNLACEEEVNTASRYQKKLTSLLHQRVVDANDPEDMFMLYSVVPFHRIIARAVHLQSLEHKCGRKRCDMLPTEIIARVSRFIEELKREHLLTTTFSQERNPLLLLISGWFNSARLIRQHQVHRSELETMLRLVRQYVVRGRCEAFDMVGMYTAHSMSEPLQQTTLNTIHNRDSTINSGMKRFVELLHCPKNKSKSVGPKIPAMDIILLSLIPEEECDPFDADIQWILQNQPTGEWDRTDTKQLQWLDRCMTKIHCMRLVDVVLTDTHTTLEQTSRRRPRLLTVTNEHFTITRSKTAYDVLSPVISSPSQAPYSGCWDSDEAHDMGLMGRLVERVGGDSVDANEEEEEDVDSEEEDDDEEEAGDDDEEEEDDEDDDGELVSNVDIGGCDGAEVDNDDDDGDDVNSPKPSAKYLGGHIEDDDDDDVVVVVNEDTLAVDCSELADGSAPTSATSRTTMDARGVDVTREMADGALDGVCVFHEKKTHAFWRLATRLVSSMVMEIPLNKSKCIMNNLFPGDIAGRIDKGWYAVSCGTKSEYPQFLDTKRTTMMMEGDGDVVSKGHAKRVLKSKTPPNLCSYADIYCSPPTDDEWVIRIRILRLTKKIIAEICSHFEESVVYTNETVAESIRFIMNIEMNQLMESVRVSGVDRITQVNLEWSRTHFTRTGVFDPTKVYDSPRIGTLGSNLLGVCSLPFVNQKQTFTNNIVETERVMGIVRAKETMERELHKVMRSSDISIHPKHISNLVATLGYSGTILSTRFSGIIRTMGVLKQARVERPTDVLHKGALDASFDPCNGAVEQLMIGHAPKIGTKRVVLMHDSVMAHDYRYASPSVLTPQVFKGSAAMRKSGDTSIDKLTQHRHKKSSRQLIQHIFDKIDTSTLIRVPVTITGRPTSAQHHHRHNNGSRTPPTRQHTIRDRTQKRSFTSSRKQNEDDADGRSSTLMRAQHRNQSRNRKLHQPTLQHTWRRNRRRTDGGGGGGATYTSSTPFNSSRSSAAICVDRRNQNTTHVDNVLQNYFELSSTQRLEKGSRRVRDGYGCRNTEMRDHVFAMHKAFAQKREDHKLKGRCEMNLCFLSIREADTSSDDVGGFYLPDAYFRELFTEYSSFGGWRYRGRKRRALVEFTYEGSPVVHIQHPEKGTEWWETCQHKCDGAVFRSHDSPGFGVLVHIQNKRTQKRSPCEVSKICSVTLRIIQEFIFGNVCFRFECLRSATTHAAAKKAPTRFRVTVRVKNQTPVNINVIDELCERVQAIFGAISIIRTQSSPKSPSLNESDINTGRIRDQKLLFVATTTVDDATSSVQAGQPPATYSEIKTTHRPTSPSYSPVSPSYSPVSPSYRPTSPSYSPVPPAYSPVSPSYSPVPPAYSPVPPADYSPVLPAAPEYDPSAPGYDQCTSAPEEYDPSAPAYNDTKSPFISTAATPPTSTSLALDFLTSITPPQPPSTIVDNNNCHPRVKRQKKE